MISDNPSRIDVGLDSRAISFENPTGARGAGGTVAGGRKGAPKKLLEPGEKVVLADIEGSGRIRHIWMTFPPARPEEMRSLWMEVFYDGLDEPSISVPCLDFFGLPHGRPKAYVSAMASAHEGRGFNCYYPMPFGKSIRVELTNGSDKQMMLYYQIDYTLEQKPVDDGYLHVTFRRENPTVIKKDFVIAMGLKGPGRFLGCAVGVRPLDDYIAWYGEGEVKMYLDSDDKHPTICGTGLEDYVGSAWGMGEHHGFYAGVPVIVKSPEKNATGSEVTNFVSFYRWHIPDPVIFQRDLTVTIQQIGGGGIVRGPDQEKVFKKYTPSGNGWELGPDVKTVPEHLKEAAEKFYALGLIERVDDYCATAFVYCQRPQAVPRVDIAAAVVDIEQRDHEVASKRKDR